MEMYHGLIYLKSGGHPITVQTMARSRGEAKRIIEAQYAGQLKIWARQMTNN